MASEREEMSERQRPSTYITYRQASWRFTPLLEVGRRRNANIKSQIITHKYDEEIRTPTHET